MREILFRGKRTDTKEWVEGSLVMSGANDLAPYIVVYANLGGVDGARVSDFSETTAFEVIPETVGQFTGIDDVNGEKIFEGDVVDEIIGRFGGNEEVVFKNGEFNTKNRMFNKPVSMLVVVGNIHDNPELLED